ncbi:MULTISPECIES: ABC transporter permease [unclassified Streptomyces]|uniref:ABC transporter permease n=1 Tax=unclassified Streptomyces TaxID=2593676 RepID=UPI002259C620|nr:MULTISPECIES: ABC transporter permease [unclassified Streptomyces]WSP53638.1 ABC transporter permease [Streptomyces sp. NBC_01241]WSU25696.1 ABC transporter permease [Streptomyces sp. NBC_01108]MCX4785030.1 ABC transporter permease [Streptomyces sp. NBC_01221]MCX4799030.1 ABC transporter permease [Streptomyces sp. NBC_01242]WSJ40221.1 ABC transporter permease [Streptomyces sp. NBC_01321]
MTTAVSPASPSPDALRRRRGLRGLRVLSQGPLFTAGVVVLAVLVLVAVLAPVLAPYDPEVLDLSASLTGTSGDHLLGTDQSGRDILSRLIHGARTGLLGPLLVVGVSTVLGMLIGLVAAWRGGWADALLSRSMDLAFAIPGLLLAILLVAVLGSGMTAPVIAMAVAYTPYVGRLVRGIARQEKARAYIESYRVQGWSGWTICLRHLLPNIAPTVLAQSAMNFGYVLMDLAALSFLGFGVQPPKSDWGAMINEGQSAILQGAMLPALAPSACIVLAVVAFGIVGEGIADRIAKRER